MPPRVLLIDDEVQLCVLMQMNIQKLGYTCDYCHSVGEAIVKLKQNKYSSILTDLNLGVGGSGLDIVKYVYANHPDTPVIVLTAYGSEKASVEALKEGAFDFLSKPIPQEQLISILDKSVHKRENSDSFLNGLVSESILGDSVKMVELKANITKLAQGQAPVYLYGESGVGKELIANTIHKLSNRNKGAFVPINCGAVPQDLLESELFGYKKGAFTGATSDKVGLIQLAHGGTLFLDEIAELPLMMQVKLLRVLQEKKIRPIGSEEELSVDFRLITATHQNLQNMIEEGKFREDLFFRLYVMAINIPPLRERGADILLLAESIKNKHYDNWSLPRKQFTEEAKLWLLNQPFKGNIRELQNVIERAVTFSDHPQITLADFDRIESNQKSFNKPLLQKNETILNELELSALLEGGLENYIDSIERNILSQIMTQNKNNKTEAAKTLKLSLRSMRYRLEKHGLG